MVDRAVIWRMIRAWRPCSRPGRASRARRPA